MPPAALARQWSRALVPRPTHRSGGGTLPSSHGSVEAGLPKTQGLRWVYGPAWRAVFDPGVVAAYPWHAPLRDGTVTDIRDGSLPPTRFASPQGVLLPRNPPEALRRDRLQPALRHARGPVPTQPWWLCERMMAEKPSRGMSTGISLRGGGVLQSQNPTSRSLAASDREKNMRCQAALFPGNIPVAYAPTGGKDVMAGFVAVSTRPQMCRHCGALAASVKVLG